MAAPLSSAFDLIVPKYQFHSYKSYTIIGNQWQAQDYIDREARLRRPMCDITVMQPASGNRTDGKDLVRDSSLLMCYDGKQNYYTPDLSNCQSTVKMPFVTPPYSKLTRNGAAKASFYKNEKICGRR